MKFMIAVFIFLIGIIAFWREPMDSEVVEAMRGDSIALNYAQFRNEVHKVAQERKEEAVYLPDNLDMPDGWVQLRGWRGVITREDEYLHCYVYGPARKEEILSIQKMLKYSAAVGWNDGGQFERNGDRIPLPSFIPDGSVVSLIRIN